MNQQLEIQALQEQLVDMQTQLAFQEDLVQTLNGLVHEQQRQIDRLICQERTTSDQLEHLLSQQGQQGEDAPPPHY